MYWKTLKNILSFFFHRYFKISQIAPQNYGKTHRVSHNIHQDRRINGKRFMGTVLFHKAFATGQKNACIGQTNNCEKKKISVGSFLPGEKRKMHFLSRTIASILRPLGIL